MPAELPSMNFFAALDEFVPLVILSPALWLRLCCFVGRPIVPAAALSGGFL
jgi:hypothetical protein